MSSDEQSAGENGQGQIPGEHTLLTVQTPADDTVPFLELQDVSAAHHDMPDLLVLPP